MSSPDVSLAADGAALDVTLPDGTVVQLPVVTLWDACPSAVSRRARMDGQVQNPPADIRIVGVTLIGRYGVNITFSDGRNRGIYPWTMLEELPRAARWSDFVHAA